MPWKDNWSSCRHKIKENWQYKNICKVLVLLCIVYKVVYWSFGESENCMNQIDISLFVETFLTD